MNPRRSARRQTRRPGHPARPPAGAFTLLELLVGVVAFAVVLAAINSVFYSGLRLRNKTAAAIEASLPLQQTLGILKRDLANIVPPGGVFSGELQTTVTTNNTLQLLVTTGQPVGPEFVTASAIMDDYSLWTDVQKVSYLLVPPTNPAAAGRDLARYVTRNMLPVTDEEPVGRTLMQGVENVRFYYYDGSAWQDSWDSTLTETKLPSAIRVEIQLAVDPNDGIERPPIELVVPLLVWAGTNDMSLAAGGTQ